MKLLSGLLNALLGRRGGRASQASPESLLLTIVFVLVMVLLAFTFLYWVTGQVAGRLFGGVWPGVPFSAMPALLFDLLGSLSDPAAAWPAPDRALLPGPLGFYAVMAALCLAPAAAGVAALSFFLRDERARKAAARPPNRRPRRRRAFARRRSLRRLVVPRPQPGRVTLGRAGGRLLAAEAGQSVAVIGPPGSMKTTGLVLPALLEWQGPAVVTSTSLQLVLDSLERRQELGTVRVYDPAGSLNGAEIPRVDWSPLRHASTWKGAQRTARSLATAAGGPAGPAPPAEPAGPVTGLLAAALQAAARTGGSVAGALRWLEDGGQEQLERAVDDADLRFARGELKGLGELDEAQRERVSAQAARVLTPWADAEAGAAADGTEPLDPDWLLDGGLHTLYLIAPRDDLQQIRPLLATVLQETVAAARDRAERDVIDLTTDAPLPEGSPPELLMVLDDAAEIGALRTLDQHATGASRGVQFLSSLRSVADARARYGERADALVNAHRARVVLSGTTDPETLDFLAHLLGDASFRKERPAAERKVTPAGVLRDPRPGAGLLLYGTLPPVEVSLRPWFRERRVRTLIGSRRLAAHSRSR